MRKKNLEFMNLPEHEIWEDGTVKSIDRIIETKSGKRVLKGKILSIKPGLQGYPHITINYKGKYKGISLHRLLAICFIPNPDNLPCVNHINGNKLNYNLINLEWCTHVKNIRHAYNTGLMPIRKGINSSSAKLDRNKVTEILDMVKNTELSYKKIGLEFGVSAGCIGDIVKGKVWNDNKLSIQDLKDFINANNIKQLDELIKQLEQSYE